MRAVLCATGDTIAHVWKENLKETKFKRKVIADEESLMKYLSKHNDSPSIVCLEDIWVGDKFDNLKELILALQEWYPNVSIMILSQYPSFSLGRTLLQLGVKGYGNARMMPVHLQDALNCIEKGDVWVYPEFVQMMIRTINTEGSNHENSSALMDSLSPREKEIVDLIYKGYSNKEIATMADITLRTVKAHTASIYEKLNVKDRIALVLFLKS